MPTFICMQFSSSIAKKEVPQRRTRKITKKTSTRKKDFFMPYQNTMNILQKQQKRIKNQFFQHKSWRMCKKNTSYAQVIYSTKSNEIFMLHNITIDISAFYNPVETKKAKIQEKWKEFFSHSICKNVYYCIINNYQLFLYNIIDKNIFISCIILQKKGGFL